MKYCVKCKTTENLPPRPYATYKTTGYYMCRDCNTARAKKYYNTVKGKGRVTAATSKYITANKDKEDAWIKVREAKKTGKLKVPIICSHCKLSKKLDAHHEDYTKALEVVWLCRACHKLTHRILQTIPV